MKSLTHVSRFVCVNIRPRSWWDEYWNQIALQNCFSLHLGVANTRLLFFPTVSHKKKKLENLLFSFRSLSLKLLHPPGNQQLEDESREEHNTYTSSIRAYTRKILYAQPLKVNVQTTSAHNYSASSRVLPVDIVEAGRTKSAN